MYVEHPFIRPGVIEARAYQISISRACVEESTLVVLPTGLGKTVIAALVIAETLRRRGGRALFLAPTKPLVLQHAQTLERLLTLGPIRTFTGEVEPSKRAGEWRESPVIVSTPQVILNDLVSGALNLDDFSLIIYDEAHRAVGNYAYVFIAEKYGPAGLALGITASPGSTAEKILEVCGNLNIKRVEIRREYDPDVRPYVHDIRVHWLVVEMPPDLLRVLGYLKNALKKQVKVLQDFGLIRKGERHSVKELLEAQRAIRQRMASAGGRPPPSLFHAAAVQAAAVEINHALELLETQGVSALNSYFDRLEEKASGKGHSRAARIVMMDEDIIRARFLARHITIEHPKLEKVGKVVADQLRLKPDSRIIVFTHYRDTSDTVARVLEGIRGCRPVRFVGQATRGEDEGLSQKEQAELIQQFRDGRYNVLVATSVGEEGLDIPSTEMVVFYEPVPSEIRTIQRRGRTGRRMPGKVVILMAKGTRDEAYYWSARRKEKRMMEELDMLRRQLAKKISVGFPSMRDTMKYIESAAGEALAAPETGPTEQARPYEAETDGVTLEKETPIEEPVAPAGAAANVDLEGRSDLERSGSAPGNNGRGEVGAAGEGSNGKGVGGMGAFYGSGAEEEGKGLVYSVHSGTKAGGGDGIGEAPAAGETALAKRKEAGADRRAGRRRKRAIAEGGLAGITGKRSRGQSTLLDFSAQLEDARPEVVVDNRELSSGVVRELSKLNVRVSPRQLAVGDFILSDRVGVERKESRDFLISLLEGRLFQQLRALRNAYMRPLLLIEGESPLTSGGLSRESVLGAVASVLVDYGVPIVFTRDERETAELLAAIARRERGEGRTPAVRGEKGAMSLAERQQFIVEGLPHVSGVLSQRLLAHFGSVEGVFRASPEELARVKGVGRKTAEELVRVIRAPYLASRVEEKGREGEMMTVEESGKGAVEEAGADSSSATVRTGNRENDTISAVKKKDEEKDGGVGGESR
ncbi:MAG: DEAD/DEAH box helicase [Thermoplasmata archaeon]